MHLFGYRICSHSLYYQQLSFLSCFHQKLVSAVLQSVGFRWWKYWLENIQICMVQGGPCTFTVTQQRAPHWAYLRFSEHSKREI